MSELFCGETDDKFADFVRMRAEKLWVHGRQLGAKTERRLDYSGDTAPCQSPGNNNFLFSSTVFIEL